MQKAQEKDLRVKKEIDRSPSLALNRLIGRAFFQTHFATLCTNSKRQRLQPYHLVTEYLRNGGISSFGLENGDRIPYMHAEGDVDSIAVVKGPYWTGKILSRMTTWEGFNLTLASLLPCSQALIRLDFVNFFCPDKIEVSHGSVRHELLTVRLVETVLPSDPL